MAKEFKVQKKKTLAREIADILFKILVFVAIIIFAYIIYDKSNFTTNSLDFSSKKDNSSKTNLPSDLKWFDDFKGIENVPNKKKKENNSENTGFRYEGFKK